MSTPPAYHPDLFIPSIRSSSIGRYVAEGLETCGLPQISFADCLAAAEAAGPI